MRNRLRALWAYLKAEHTHPARLAVAVFVGVTIGCEPIYGLHTVLCLLIAQAFKLNKAATVGAAYISNPIMAPPLVAAGIVVGEWVRFGTLRPLDLHQAEHFLSGLSMFAGQVPDLWLSCLVGDTLIALVLAPILALVAYRVASRAQASDLKASGEVAQAPGDAPGRGEVGVEHVAGE